MARRTTSLFKQTLSFKFSHVITFAAALLFGLAYMLTPALDPKEPTGQYLNVPRFCIGFLIFLGGTCVVESIAKHYRVAAWDKPFGCSIRCVFLLSFALIFSVGLIYLLIYYPGVGMYDTLAILTERKPLGMAHQHPWFYCFLIDMIVNVSFASGGGYETALVVESLLQISVVAAVSAYCISWLHSKGCKRISLLICLVIYSFWPILNFHMISLLKDVPFSYMLLCWVPLLYDFWESDGRSIEKPTAFLAMACCLVFSLLRNNGIYVSAFILFCMLIAYRIQWKRIAGLFGILACVIIGSVFVQHIFSIDHMFKETVGIPLQQIAAVICRDGEISDESLEFMDQVIPIDVIKEKYSPYSSDGLKWSGSLNSAFLNEHKAEFLRVWAELLVPNFKIYTKAYLQATYGFWSLKQTESTIVCTTIYVAKFDDVFTENSISIQSVLPERLQSTLKELTFNAAYAWREGRTFWCFIMLAVVLYRLNGKKVWITAVPGSGGWLTIMISTPIAYQWRYILFLAIMLPVLLAIILLPTNRDLHSTKVLDDVEAGHTKKADIENHMEQMREG